MIIKESTPPAQKRAERLRNEVVATFCDTIKSTGSHPALFGEFTRIPPGEYYPKLLNMMWYGIFKAGRPKEDTDREYIAFRKVFDLIGNADIETLLGFGVGRYGHNAEEHMRSMKICLNQIPKEPQLVMPVMNGGFFFGAVVYNHMKMHNLALGPAFVGHERICSSGVYSYNPETVYIHSNDLETIKSHLQYPMLLVDDTLDKGITSGTIAKTLYDIGAKSVGLAVETDIATYNSPECKRYFGLARMD